MAAILVGEKYCLTALSMSTALMTDNAESLFMCRIISLSLKNYLLYFLQAIFLIFKPPVVTVPLRATLTSK